MDRRTDYETRMKSRGLVKVTVWCSPDCAETVKRLAAESRAASDEAG